MPAPREYKDIKRWGIMLGYNPGYIEREQEKAARQNAPIDAIFEQFDDTGTRSGVWATRSSIDNEVTKMRLDRMEADEQKARR